MFRSTHGSNALRHLSSGQIRFYTSSNKLTTPASTASSFFEELSRYKQEEESSRLAASDRNRPVSDSTDEIAPSRERLNQEFIKWEHTHIVQPHHHWTAVNAEHYASNKSAPPKWDGRRLFITDGSTNGGLRRVPERWLRDHCQCEECTHPITKQRQYNTFSPKPAPQIRDCEIQVQGPSPLVKVEWQDGHKSTYPLDFLQGRNSMQKEAYRRGIHAKQLWDSGVARSPPSVDYRHVQSSGVADLLANIRKFGFCFVPGCPDTPEATQALIELIGPIRNTHYGGFYDFTSNMASKDTAYTDLALDVHTDTTYFSDPAGLQAFHMLSHTGGKGGESVLVDGFNAATKLFGHENGDAYRTLSRTGVYWHASGNDDVSIQPYTAFPVLEHDPVRKHLMRVRWNNSDRGGLNMAIEKTDGWYKSASKFNDILSTSEMQYWFQLQPGTPLIFDNWRVLHGRSQFTGKRRMCGGYINYDDYTSKYRLTNYGKDTVMATTFTG